MRTEILRERGGSGRTGNTFTESKALDVRKEGIPQFFGVKIEFDRVLVLGRRWILGMMKRRYGYGNEEEDSDLPLSADLAIAYGRSL